MRRPDHGFLLLPVLLLLSMIASAAYLSLRDSPLSVAGAQRQSDLHKARAAAEAGLHRVVHEAHRLGCAGSYPVQVRPLADTAFDGASYSAYASKHAGTPVDISAVGRFGDARVELARSNVVIHRAAAQTMVLQPDASAQDTTLKATPSGNEADDQTLTLTPDVNEALLGFNLSDIPEGSHIVAAQLSVRIADLQGSGLVQLHRVQSDWTEQANTQSRDGSAAWIHSAGDAHPTPVVSTPTTGLGWMSWSITELVDGWVKGRWPNQGVLLRGIGFQTLSMASSDYPIPALRPRLVVSFHPPCGWNLPQQKQTMVPIADATMSEASPTVNEGASDTLRALNNGHELRMLLQFDTSSIGIDKTIKSATLRLTFTGLANDHPTPQDIDLFARRNEQGWDEPQVSWYRRTASALWLFAGAGVLVPMQPQTKTLPKDARAGTVVEFDAKDWVMTWVASPQSNHGLHIRLPRAAAQTLAFGSRESLSAPPTLSIEYE